MTKKEILRVIAFCLLVCVMLVLLCDLFEGCNNVYLDSRIATYATLEPDTVDAVYIGTSGVDRYWLAAKAYEEYGMTVYPLSSDALPSWLHREMLEYAFAYQKPELVLIDIRAFSQTPNENMDAHAHFVLNALPFGSRVWFQSVLKTMDCMHRIDPEKHPRYDISYLLSFIRFHSKWEEENYSFADNIGDIKNEYAGFFLSSSASTAREPMEPLQYDATALQDLDPMGLESLYEVLDYCREQGVQVLFVDSPQIMTETEMGRSNRLYQLLEDEGIDYLSCYTEDTANHFTIDVDLETDFYNPDHLNYYGAEKYTAHLAAYLDANYDLPDRRDDPAAQAYWDGVYDLIQTRIADYEAS